MKKQTNKQANNCQFLYILSNPLWATLILNDSLLLTTDVLHAGFDWRNLRMLFTFFHFFFSLYWCSTPDFLFIFFNAMINIILWKLVLAVLCKMCQFTSTWCSVFLFPFTHAKPCAKLKGRNIDQHFWKTMLCSI